MIKLPFFIIDLGKSLEIGIGNNKSGFFPIGHPFKDENIPDRLLENYKTFTVVNFIFEKEVNFFNIKKEHLALAEKSFSECSKSLNEEGLVCRRPLGQEKEEKVSIKDLKKGKKFLFINGDVFTFKIENLCINNNEYYKVNNEDYLFLWEGEFVLEIEANKV